MMGKPLQNLKHTVGRAIRAAVADADGDDIIQPLVLRSRCLEDRLDTEVITSRIDRLTLSSRAMISGGP